MVIKMKKRTISLAELTEMLRQEGWIALNETLLEVRAPGYTWLETDPNRLEILFEDKQDERNSD